MNENEITQRIASLINNIHLEDFVRTHDANGIKKAIKGQLRKLATEYKQKASLALDPTQAVNLQVMAMQVEQTLCSVEEGELRINVPTLEGQVSS